MASLSPSGGRERLDIAILGFNRPEYLSRTLISLAAQLDEHDRVYLFQDGAFNPFIQAHRANVEDIEDCITLFKKIIPSGICFESRVNLGIAGNYRRAEAYIFKELRCSRAVFLEDDLVLSPDYLDVIDQLLSFAEQDSNIGYVSAYGDLWAAFDKQSEAEGEIRPMHENWGFGLTRSAWERQSDIRNAYWDIVKANDYRARDAEAIGTLYRTLGYDLNITSQDGARWIACAEHGLARLTTATCHAVYIGETGEHFVPELYRKFRFDRSNIYPARPKLKRPDSGTVSALAELERNRLQKGYRHSYAEIYDASERNDRLICRPDQRSNFLLRIDCDATQALLALARHRCERLRRARDEAVVVIAQNERAHATAATGADVRLQEQGAALDQMRSDLRHMTEQRDAALSAYEGESAKRQATERSLREMIHWSVAYNDATLASLSWRLTKALRWVGIGRPVRPPLPAFLAKTDDDDHCSTH